MPRAPRNSRLATAEARSNLPVQKEPYWHQIIEGTFLGLAKGKRGSAWVVRQRVGTGYKSRKVGHPDDKLAADGDVVLSHKQAVAVAHKIAQGAEPATRGHYGDGLTLNEIVDQYLQHRMLHPGGRTGRVMSKASADMTRGLWARNGAGSIGQVPAARLNAAALRKWHAGIVASPPTKRGRVTQYDGADPTQRASRQASANRILTICKAALENARVSGLTPESAPDFWRRVKPFKIDEGAEQAPRMLEPGEITRLLNAAAPDMRELLKAGLMTGARYGELVSMRVADYSGESGTVRIAQNKTGKVLRQPLTDEGRAYFDRMTAGRDPRELILQRSDGRPWGKSDARRPVMLAAKTAGLADVSFKATRATYGKLLLLATLNIELVAKALGHSDSRITRKHYAQFLPSELASGIANMRALGIEAKTAKVSNLR